MELLDFKIKKKTILIFGVSSFVGSNLAQFLSREYRVIGTYFKTPVSIPGVLTIQCDVLNRDMVQFIIYTFRPDVTIYSVGLTSLTDCAANEKLADALNTIGVFNITFFSERYKSKFCYLSSSYIFPGTSKSFVENDTPDPKSQYGKTKAAAEFYIQKSCLNYLIYRCCNFYGKCINPQQTTWFEHLQKKIIKQENIVCDDNIKVGFLDPSYLALIIKLSIERNVTNRLFQVSSKNILSYYEFSKLYTKIFQENDLLVQKGTWPFPTLKSEYGDGSNDDKKYFELSTLNLESFFNVDMPSIEESLEFTFLKLGGSKKQQKFNNKNSSSIRYI